jgi:hypothetical protein
LLIVFSSTSSVSLITRDGFGMNILLMSKKQRYKEMQSSRVECGMLDGRRMKICETLSSNPLIVFAPEYLDGFLQLRFTSGGVSFVLFICIVILSFLPIVLGIIIRAIRSLRRIFLSEKKFIEYLKFY